MASGSVDDDDLRRTPTGLSLAGGSALVVMSAVVAAAVIPPDALPGRVLVIAIAVGVFAALVPDTWASLGVTVLSFLVFTGFLANQHGELTSLGGTVWSYLVVIAFAFVLGLGQRFIRAGRHSGWSANERDRRPQFVAPSSVAGEIDHQRHGASDGS